MRRFRLFLSIISSVLIVGCDLSYYVVELVIQNESGQILFVESNIDSFTTSGIQTLKIHNGTGGFIAQSKKYSDSAMLYLPLDSIIGNEDAYVSVYTISDSEEKHLVHTWYYSDREKDGRELFSEKCLTQDEFHGHDGGNFLAYTFTILPEDLE